uniref:Uncharacterized protein n=1 Tax=Ralstonia solanacearum TaxID=305 RepID=A0A0S4TMW0_RALSL|nr:protein of unknown function [Ralstonia solanacearum]
MRCWAGSRTASSMKCGASTAWCTTCRASRRPQSSGSDPGLPDDWRPLIGIAEFPSNEVVWVTALEVVEMTASSAVVTWNGRCRANAPERG